MESIKVRTTQNVFIQYPIASLGDRILARVIDSLILIFYSLVMLLALVQLGMQVVWVWIVMIAIPFLLYFVLFEIFMNGQTPGKRVRNIQVIRMDGTSATVADYLIRWILGFIEFYILSGVIAVVAILINGKGQRLGDMVAGTTVVKRVEEKQITANEIFVTPSEGYQLTFNEVVYLTERDIELIQRALEANVQQANRQPAIAVTQRIKTMLGIQSDMPDLQFLYTIIRDFHHVSSRS